jgi:hypothetical protein
MRASLVRAGMRPVRLTYTNASLFPVLATVRTMQRVTGWPVPGIELEVPPPPVNSLLAGVLAVEAGVVRRVDMPFGSSVLCLAKRN